MSNDSFTKWLIEETEGRGWSYAELGRRAGLAGPTISLVINDQKNPGPIFCRGIARALNLPPEIVFRKAGLLPPEPEEDAELTRVLFLFAQLPPDRRALIMKQLEALVETPTPAMA